ncbi:MAG TPA: glycosyltransferase family 4 protein [Pyrinomonadaceae bacterium]|nr:glycosyltransferase family 4 protein [Pyrinomonadaceae bacterium]
MSTASGPRVLLSAYQCGPGMGSVSQIGWEWYSRLAARLPVTLVTHVRNREALTNAGAPIGDSEIIYIDTEWFAGPLYRFAKKLFPYSEHSVFLISSLDFFFYDWSAVRLLKRRMKQGEQWDLAHAVTPVSTMAPTGLHTLGLPVILGPLNAGLGTPAGFDEFLKKDSTWLYPVRNFGKLIDAVIGSTRNATTILTATRATVSSIKLRYRRRCVQMLENGIDLNRFKPSPWPAPPAAGNPLKILFVGRLVPFKAISLLLEAAARVRAEFPVEVTIVGDGPMAGEWKDKAESLGIADQTFFKGALSLDAVAAEMQRAHVFCLPSVRESGGAVLLEAMASARPCIAVDFGGPAEIVDDGVGSLIPPFNSGQVINGITETLRDLVNHPSEWKARGEEGRRRAELLFGWDAKVDSAVRLYQDLLKPAPEVSINVVANFAR